MEDPWASGSAWATPSKRAERPASPLSSPPAVAHLESPPSRFDVSDPWGTSTAVEAPIKQVTEGHWDAGSPGPKTEIIETPGWGGGWGAAGSAGDDEIVGRPSRSPSPRPQDSPEWGFSGGGVLHSNDPSTLKDSLEHNDDLVASIPGPASPLHDSETTSPGRDQYMSDQPHSTALSPPQLGTINIPTSPSFGDEFGGFSSGFGDDPWETKKQDNGWGESSRRSSSSTASRRSKSNDGVDATTGQSDDGWGGATSRNPTERMTVQLQAGMDQEWEEAQQRIRVTEERVPREKIDKLHTGWKDLVTNLVGDRNLEVVAEAEGVEYEARLSRQEDQIRETLRSLAMLPPDTNTYPPVLSSLETYERYRYALGKPNTTPETSLLNMPLGRRSRRNENTLENLDSWTSRSRLGEPEAPQPDTNQQAEETKPKWSFWRKTAPEKPLVTSGGGILEVKPSSPAPSSSVPIEPRPSMSSATSISASAAKMSRPASPALSNLPSAIDVVEPGNASAGSPGPVPAPSAVSRFFGRLSRRQVSQPSGNDQGNMEFSADDFSFLDQVESMSTPDQEKAIGDLLAMDGGRTEEIASLESMLKSKPTQLPAPLAPPPMASRSSASTHIPSHAPRDMDLLSGLDFAGDSGNLAGPSRPSTAQMQSITSQQSTDWDDFDLLAGPTVQPTAPASRVISVAPKITSPPPLLPSQPATRPYTPQYASSTKPSIQPSPPQQDLDDFADFAPQATNSQSTEFDDFGDFGDFSTPPPPPVPASSRAFMTPTSSSQLQAPPPSFSQGHTKRASLDHTLTLNLMNDASASKGKRWPAPPSPLAPSLEPPPKAPNAGAFPFISPPPGTGGSRPSVGMRGLGDLMDDTQQTTSPVMMAGSHTNPVPPVRVQSPPFAPPAPMQPSRTASPLMPAVNASSSRPASTAPPHNSTNSKSQSLSQAQSQPGLSAQDLSFFDNL